MYTGTFVRVSGRAATEQEIGKQTWKGAREVVAWHVMKQTVVAHVARPPVWYGQVDKCVDDGTNGWMMGVE